MHRTTDTQIKEELLLALRNDARLALMEIEVSVDRYVVTLAGAVERIADELRARDVAMRIEGVHDVRSQLRVENSTPVRTDEEIAQAVRHALEWDSTIPEANIQYSVSNGWVALHGTVNLVREREVAERIVSRIAGVRGVYNEIVVNSSEIKAENVRDSIEEELKRRARHQAEDIKIILKDGVVTLSGGVQSWEERCAVINAARHAPGVGVVKDGLAITPPF